MDESALVRQYTPLVTGLAYQLARKLPPGVSVDDLIQSGMIGLLEAARNHNEARGASLQTYARIRIHGAMVDSLRERGRQQRVQPGHRNRRAGAVTALEQELGRTPRKAEIVARLGLSEMAYSKAEQTHYTNVSLDEIAHGDPSPGPEQIAESAEVEAVLRTAISELSEREQILWGLCRDGISLREAGSAIGVSESRACLIVKAIVQSLRQRLAE